MELLLALGLTAAGTVLGTILATREDRRNPPDARPHRIARVPSVETVTGPVDAGELGLTLIHEHFRTTDEGVRLQWPHAYDEDAEWRRRSPTPRR